MNFLLKAFVLVLWMSSNCAGQDLNVIPNILRPYLWKIEDIKTINLLANISEKILNVKQIGLDFDFILRNEYDFIIVGSGPAGSLLANRLSENKDWNVLLLEAGKPEGLINYIPLAAAFLASSDYNWDYVLNKSPGACLGAIDQKCAYPRGRALGGTSTINHMAHMRGNRYDFDNWEELGNEGWSYDDVLPYYKKHEKANLGEYSYDEYHNTRGELSVEFAPFRTALVDFYIAAARELGHDIIDYNGETQIGTGYVQRNTLKGFRHSAASAFLKKIIKKRKNLHILTSALVTNIIIDPETKTAVGVNFLRKNQTYSVYAKKEVILSAGAFHSPQLLMLSGIGPEDQLEKIGVDVIKDLPVGKTMYDHYAVPNPVIILNTTGNSIHLKKIGLLEVLQLIKKTGPLTSTIGVEALSYGKSPNTDTPSDYPDFELIMLAATYTADLGTGLAKSYRLRKDIYKTVFKPIESPEIDQMFVVPVLLNPKSKGRLYLKDNSIFSPPVFEYPFLEEEIDIEVLLAGIKEAIRFTKTNVMQALGARIHDIPIPGCTHFNFGSDDYWRCVIRTLGISLHHQVSTCKMGPDDDDDAVVDPKLRVHGINHLRVADTSILPTQIAAHPNAVSYMIGEKLADMLKKEWLGDYKSYDSNYSKDDSIWPFRFFGKHSKEKTDKKKERVDSRRNKKTHSNSSKEKPEQKSQQGSEEVEKKNKKVSKTTKTKKDELIIDNRSRNYPYSSIIHSVPLSTPTPDNRFKTKRRFYPKDNKYQKFEIKIIPTHNPSKQKESKLKGNRKHVIEILEDDYEEWSSNFYKSPSKNLEMLQSIKIEETDDFSYSRDENVESAPDKSESDAVDK